MGVVILGFFFVNIVTLNMLAIVPNTCNLRKLVIPATKGDPFVIETVRTFEHAEYISNCWLVKFATNGRYLFAPTSDGRLFIFSIATGKVTAILHEHGMGWPQYLLLIVTFRLRTSSRCNHSSVQKTVAHLW